MLTISKSFTMLKQQESVNHYQNRYPSANVFHFQILHHAQTARREKSRFASKANYLTLCKFWNRLLGDMCMVSSQELLLGWMVLMFYIRTYLSRTGASRTLCLLDLFDFVSFQTGVNCCKISIAIGAVICRYWIGPCANPFISLHQAVGLHGLAMSWHVKIYCWWKTDKYLFALLCGVYLLFVLNKCCVLESFGGCCLNWAGRLKKCKIEGSVQEIFCEI